MNFQLYDFIIDDYVKVALKEDIGFCDISTSYLPNADKIVTAELNSRVDGIVCGLKVFERVFKVLDAQADVKFHFTDGDVIKKGDKIATVRSSAKNVLTAERTALNYVQRMSAIATLTSKYVKAIENTNAKIVDTRKTTPGFRLFEKYSVQVGGADLHRFNLSDCVMLKDNHIALVGGIKEAVAAIKKATSHAHKIEVECDTLEQVQQALDAKVDIIMLDNMSVEDMKKGVALINGQAVVEASGCVTLDNIAEIAKTGVDIISTSAVVTKAGSLDLGLDF